MEKLKSDERVCEKTTKIRSLIITASSNHVGDYAPIPGANNFGGLNNNVIKPMPSNKFENAEMAKSERLRQMAVNNDAVGQVASDTAKTFFSTDWMIVDPAEVEDFKDKK